MDLVCAGATPARSGFSTTCSPDWVTKVVEARSLPCSANTCATSWPITAASWDESVATASRPVWTPILPPGSAKALAVFSSKTVISQLAGRPRAAGLRRDRSRDAGDGADRRSSLRSRQLLLHLLEGLDCPSRPSRWPGTGAAGFAPAAKIRAVRCRRRRSGANRTASRRRRIMASPRHGERRSAR